MDAAQREIIIQPGIDHPSTTNNLHNKIASSLSTALGQEIVPAQLVPTAQQLPEAALAQEPQPEMDLDDLYSGLKGRPRTDPSKNFLKVFLGRLKKKNPEKEVVPVG